MTKQVSRRIDVEEYSAEAWFRIECDIIFNQVGYNGHEYTLHIRCKATLVNLVYTIQKKSDAL
jgi:hypothetical protein